MPKVFVGRDRSGPAHDAAGLRALRRSLARRGMPAELPIAIERTSGLLARHTVQITPD